MNDQLTGILPVGSDRTQKYDISTSIDRKLAISSKTGYIALKERVLH